MTTTEDNEAREVAHALVEIGVNPDDADEDAPLFLDALAADGWAIVRTGGWQHSVTEPLDPERLPKPMSLDFCQLRLATRRDLVKRGKADPSSMPVLLRRPLLVQLPWEPVPEGSEQ